MSHRPARRWAGLALALAVAVALTGCARKSSPRAAGGMDDDPGPIPATQVVASARTMQHPLVGKAAPAWTLKDPAGRPHALKDFRGTPTVLVFWTTW